jgi:hypothetical protein
MANEEEAAIAFSGKFTRNGLLPWAGVVTSIPEAVARRGDAPTGGAKLREARFFHASLTGPLPRKESAGFGVAVRGATRAIIPAEPSCPESGSERGDGFDSTAGGKLETVEGASAKDSEFRALSTEFSSRGVTSSRLTVPEAFLISAKVFAAGRAETGEVVSLEGTGAAAGSA